MTRNFEDLDVAWKGRRKKDVAKTTLRTRLQTAATRLSRQRKTKKGRAGSCASRDNGHRRGAALASVAINECLCCTGGCANRLSVSTGA
jgi:hypothetical protein